MFLPCCCVPVEAEGGPCAGGGCFCASSSSGAGAAGSDGHSAQAGSLLLLAPVLGAGAKEGKRVLGRASGRCWGCSCSPCAGSDICNLFELVLCRLPALRELFLPGLSAQQQSKTGEGRNGPSLRGDRARVFNRTKLTISLLAEEKGGIWCRPSGSMFPWEGRGRASLPHTRQERALGARPARTRLLRLLLLLPSFPSAPRHLQPTLP